MRLNVKRKPFLNAVLLLTSLGVATSCIDNSYDLDKDIDMTVNVGGQYLAFPLGNTEKITMDKIIEIKSGDDLQLINSEYHLLKKGTIDNATTDVKGVTIEGSVTTIGETLIADIPTGLLSDKDFGVSIDNTDNITAEAKNIDQAVKEIKSLTAQSPADLTIALKIKTENTIDYNQIKITDLKITLPDFLDFESDPNLKDHILSLSETSINKGDSFKYTLKLKGYKFGKKATEGEIIQNQSLSIEESVTVSAEATVTVKSGSHGKLSIVPEVTLTDMPIKSITGIVQPTIEAVSSTVNLENLPDFLQDDATELDITNPIFTFIANNPLEAPITLNGTLSGTKDGKTIAGSTVKIGKSSTDGQEITLQKGDNVIALSRLGTGGPAGAVNIKVSDINNLIKKIPDAVNVTLQPAVEYSQYYTSNLEQTYSMNSSYDIDIPLSFGNELQIVYKDSVDDFRSDLEDVEFNKAIVAFGVDNIIPLKLEIKESNVTPKDVNGNKINDIKVTVTGVIAESKDGKTVSTSQVNITVEETKEGAMNKLDGLAFKVTAVPGQSSNIQLRSDQWLQLKDMKLRVPNGIKIDLN